MLKERLADSVLRVGYSIFKPRFILFHVIYITLMAILASIMIYPNGNIRYIDALFFGMAAATQSGLNTIDLNKMTTWQQLVLYLIPIFTNPMAIHTFLVFIRLYWFEKAFQDIAMRSRIDHRIRKARSYAVTDANRDIEMHGVAGRPITILHTAVMTEANFPGYRRFNASQNYRSSEETQSSHDPFDYSHDHRRNASSDLDIAVESEHESENEDDTRGAVRPSSDNSDTSPDRSYTFALSRRTSSPGPAVSGLANRDIRFVDLPSPRDHQHRNRFSYVENGPALVIKSPREQELEEQQAAAEAERKGTAEIKFVSPIAGVRGLRSIAKRRKSSSNYGLEFKARRRSSEDGDADEEEIGETLRHSRSHIPGPSGSSPTAPDKIKRATTIEAPGREGLANRLTKNISVGDFFFHRSQTIERAERIIARTFGRRDPSPDGARSERSVKSLALPYLSYAPTVARNSTFVGLTDEQRAELGGVEYRALRTLAVVLVSYFLGFFLLANICLIPWIVNSARYRAAVEQYAQKPAWWGAYMATSSFMDVGLSIVPTSMVEFRTAVFPLLLMCFLIVIGNTGFPCMLRLVIWILSKVFPAGSATSESLHFLLDHPRRCFTLLFPSGPTWWLLAVLVILNGADLILFVILDLTNSIIDTWDGGQKLLDGLFQAISTRTAGMTVVDLSQLHPAVQVSYLVMMYISVLPIAISVRRTNVYEEQSLGIYGSPGEEEEDDEEAFSELEEDSFLDDNGNANGISNGNGASPAPTRTAIPNSKEDTEKQMRRRDSAGVLSTKSSKSRFKRKRKPKTSFVTNHLRRQLSFDLWYIFLGLFVICIADGHKLQDQSSYDFNIFAVLFEVVSAYGTVGLSLGFPNVTTSFSGQFSTVSKLVIVAMMLRGRHRGLPYAVDRAILLPSQSLQKKDLKHEARSERRFSTSSNPGMPRSNTFGRTSAFEMPREV